MLKALLTGGIAALRVTSKVIAQQHMTIRQGQNGIDKGAGHMITGASDLQGTKLRDANHRKSPIPFL